jgi:hypothetical protein
MRWELSLRYRAPESFSGYQNLLPPEGQRNKVALMSGGLAQPPSLSWLYGLAMKDRVALLKNPRHTLTDELAGHVADNLGWQGVVHLSDGPDHWRLAESVTSQLSVVRKKLDKWWSSDSLTNRERDYLIEHRADDEPPPHAVRVEPAAVRAYLEMKARGAARC